MNINQFNEAFHRAYATPNSAKTQKQELCSYVIESVDRARRTNPEHYRNSQSLERVIIEAIEDRNPGKFWWEVVDCNIQQILFEEADINHAIERIFSLNESAPSYAGEYKRNGYTIKFNNNGTAAIIDKNGKVVRTGVSDAEADEWIDAVSDEVDESLDDEVTLDKRDSDFHARYFGLKDKGYKTVWTGEGKIRMKKSGEVPEQRNVFYNQNESCKRKLKESDEEFKSAEYIDYLMKSYALSKDDLLDVLDNICYLLRDNGYDDYGVTFIQDYIDDTIVESKKSRK